MEGYNPVAVRTLSVPLRVDAGPIRSKRLLALAGDERLVAHVRRGNEAAFEVLYERYVPGILGFCRHMLGSREEAEDAVQQVFASAYRDLLRDEREIRLRPWLYTIARNRCMSILRARHDELSADGDVPVAGLDRQLETRSELRELLRDLRDLPEGQRAALLLSEAGGLSHAEVAETLDCEVPKVKALVFRARTGLMQRREARELPCAEVREQLASLRGGSLRRSHLRHHLRECPGCRQFREEVKRQRALMAAALPVTPSLGLKASVLSAAGLGGGGGGAAAGGGAGLAGALSAAGGTAAKLAVVGALIGGGVVAEQAVQHGSGTSGGSVPAPVQPAGTTGTQAGTRDHGAAEAARRHGSGAGATHRAASERATGRAQAEQSQARSHSQRGLDQAQVAPRGSALTGSAHSQSTTTDTTTTSHRPEATLTLPSHTPQERSRDTSGTSVTGY